MGCEDFNGSGIPSVRSEAPESEHAYAWDNLCDSPDAVSSPAPCNSDEFLEHHASESGLGKRQSVAGECGIVSSDEATDDYEEHKNAEDALPVHPDWVHVAEQLTADQVSLVRMES